MRKLSELLQADPFNADAVRARLEELGFAETAPPQRPAPSLSRIPQSRPRRGPFTTRSVSNAPAPAKAATTEPVSTIDRAESLIDGLATSPAERTVLMDVLDDLIEELSRAADPLRALTNFSRLTDAAGERTAFFSQLRRSSALRSRLCRVMSFSQALADTLIREPELIASLADQPHSVSRGVLRSAAARATASLNTPEARLDALRRFRRRETLRIGLLDMERQTWRNAADFQLVVEQISDLAQVCVQATLAIIAPAYLESGSDSKPGSDNRFIVLAMGKLGARELNYSSDIDLIFLYDGDKAVMDRLAQGLFKALTDSTIEGALYRVDMRLRPEGKAGPLATPFQYALSYYESYAAPWEWQAFIKARAIAALDTGSVQLARRFRRFMRSITWARRADDSHLRAMLEMKRRSENTPEGLDHENVKQGPGAIRDAEWVTQQLQMMVGPQHPRARASSTLRALEVLRAFNALTYEEAGQLREGYLFLRVLEHRLQLLDERAVRTLPDDERERVALARRMGCTWREAAAARWLSEEHERHRREVRALCERMFWGWRDTADFQAPSLDDEPEISIPGLAALNGHIEAPETNARLQRLAQGTRNNPLPPALSRQVRAALPDALQQLEHAADPERAFVNLERLCDASGNRLSLLRSLGEAPELARAVFAILGGSERLTDTLIRFPELLDLAAQRPLLAHPKSWEEARADCRAYCLTFRDRLAALRRWKRREMLRIGLRDLVMDAPPHEITGELADLARACLTLGNEEIATRLRPASDRLAFTILGMGKLGGGEMHYSSDADVVFAHYAPSPFDGDRGVARHWAEELMHEMSERTEDGAIFEVDARLRPEGRNGALVPTVEGFIEYFEREPGGLAVWERQALTRARYLAGDAETGARLMVAIRHVAFPTQWKAEWGDELRHIKNRVETERAGKSAPRGNDTLFDVKLGRGALSDIEWCAQWLAMRHGAAVPALQTPNTRRQIEAARVAEVLDHEEANSLIDAYDFLRRAELRLQITQESVSSAVRADTPTFRSWARAVFPDDAEATSRFAEDWAFHTNAARAVMERVRDSL